jgi:hypothetical protein
MVRSTRRWQAMDPYLLPSGGSVGGVGPGTGVLVSCRRVSSHQEPPRGPGGFWPLRSTSALTSEPPMSKDSATLPMACRHASPHIGVSHTTDRSSPYIPPDLSILHFGSSE